MELSERLAIFFERLSQLNSAASAEDALQQIVATLTEVEDQFSGIKRKEEPGKTFSGRMYPPREDSISRLADGGIKARTRGNRIFLGADGSIHIEDLRGTTLFEKEGTAQQGDNDD